MLFSLTKDRPVNYWKVYGSRRSIYTVVENATKTVSFGCSYNGAIWISGGDDADDNEKRKLKINDRFEFKVSLKTGELSVSLNGGKLWELRLLVSKTEEFNPFIIVNGVTTDEAPISFSTIVVMINNFKHIQHHSGIICIDCYDPLTNN